MDKLDEILENTRQLKSVIIRKKEVKKETQEKKQEKRKEQVKKAQEKFKQVKTNINEELQNKVNSRVEELGTNTSNYIQILIKKDLSKSKTVEIDIKSSVKNMSLFEFIKLKYL